MKRPARHFVLLSVILLLFSVLDPRDTFPQSPARYLCPHSNEYWKTHTISWPASTLFLGTEAYSHPEAEDLLSQNTKKDASVIRARQLIATKLNLVAGSDPPPILAAITSADSLLGNHQERLPFAVPPWSGEGQNMIGLATLLDAYINAETTPGCATSPVPNLPPSITSLPVETAAKDQFNSYDVQATDPDAGDVLAYSLAAAPAGMTIDVGSGIISWAPLTEHVWEHRAGIRVVDSGGLVAVQEFTITATRHNLVPSIVSMPRIVAGSGFEYRY